MIIDINENCS